MCHYQSILPLKPFTYNIYLQSLMTVMLFSLWAIFALLVVNNQYDQNLPGYVMGEICIWEVVALIIAGLISRFIFTRWGGVKFRTRKQKTQIIINRKYFDFVLIYFLIIIVVAIWQFYRFSQTFVPAG